MEKRDVKLESFLTVISPGQTVRIIPDSEQNRDFSIDEVTEFKGTAVAAFREYAGKRIMIKHVSPELERETGDEKPRYIMHVFIYR